MAVAGIPPRRNVLAAVAATIIGAFVGIVPLAAGLATFLDPLLRRKLIELIRNGEVVKTFRVPDGLTFFDAAYSWVENGDSWMIARCFGKDRDNQVAISNPINSPCSSATKSWA